MTLPFSNEDFTQASRLDAPISGAADIERLICFTPGTMIATSRGEIAVEALRISDRIVTRDNGLRPVRWIGATHLTAADFAARPHLRPVLLKGGSLGHDVPQRDLVLSPNHRVLLTGHRTGDHFDEYEVFAAAKHLLGMDGVEAVAAGDLTYHHFMCDAHEVILSNGAWTESFQPDVSSLQGLGSGKQNEIYDLFPSLRTPEGLAGYAAARKTLGPTDLRRPC